MTVKKVCKQVRVKKFVPNKKGDIGMEVYYLCQPNTYYVIAITAAHQIHEQRHRYIGSIPPLLCPLFYLEQIFLPTLNKYA